MVCNSEGVKHHHFVRHTCVKLLPEGTQNWIVAQEMMRRVCSDYLLPSANFFCQGFQGGAKPFFLLPKSALRGALLPLLHTTWHGGNWIMDKVASMKTESCFQKSFSLFFPPLPPPPKKKLSFTGVMSNLHLRFPTNTQRREILMYIVGHVARGLM